MNVIEEIRVDSTPVTDPKGLTERQDEVLKFIRKSVTERGHPPTLREIGAHMGLRSTNAVNDLLRALERKGYLVREEIKPSAKQHGALTKEQNERIRAALKQVLALDRFAGQASHVAMELGVDQSTIAGFLGGRQGTSFQVAQGIARLLGCSVTELVTGIAPAVPQRQGDDEYPSRARVLAMADAKGVDRAAVAALRLERLKGEDPGDEYWTKRLVELITQSKRLDAELKRAETPAELAAFGEPEEDVEKD